MKIQPIRLSFERYPMVLKNNRIISIVLCTLMMLSLVSCEYIGSILNPQETTGEGTDTTAETESGDHGETSPNGGTVAPGDPITLPTPNIQKNFINPITGLPSEDDLALARAVAFVIDNHYLSFPQSGISKADIICEFINNDGTTSLMAICKDPTEAATIGPLGVANSVMLSFADGFDAIVFARNATETVKATIEDSVTPFFAYELNKPSFGFFESADRKNQFGYAYSVMGEGVRLLKAVSAQGVSSESDKTYSEIFDIYTGERDYTLAGKTSENIYIPASPSQHIQLVYSASEKMYYRYAFGTKQQTDVLSGDHVAFKNILMLSGDDNLAVTDENEPQLTLGQRGSGYFATGGKFINITWVRNSDGAFRFYKEDGTTFEIPAGNIYMSFFTKAQLASVNMNYKR